MGRPKYQNKQPEEIAFDDGHLTCPVCKDSKFWITKGQLNTVMMSMLNLDWANPTADCYVCGGCGHILWFMQRGAF